MKKTVIRALTLILALCMLFGCASNATASSVSETESIPVSSEVSSVAQSSFVASQSASAVSRTKSVAIKPEKSQKELFSESVTNFGLTMLSKMPRDGESTVFSPVSLAVPLSLLANGAKGTSYDELAAVLGVKDITTFNEQFAAYQKFLNENSEFIGTEKDLDHEGERSYLKYGSSIWAKKTVVFEPQFLNVNDLYYAAKLNILDSNVVVATQQINDWVKQMTEGKVPEIVNEKVINNASTVLANAIYFEFYWDFKYKYYTDGEFRSYDGRVIPADYLAGGNSRYISGKGVKGFKENYFGGQYYFAALLPDEGTDIYDFAASLTGEKLQELLKNEKERDLRTWIPKFKIDEDLDCADLLKAAGIGQIFSDGADLSGYATDGYNPLYVDKVIQKAGIAVDKGGTVAYAATITTTPAMGGDPDAVIITIKLDRPFLYVIADEEYDIPLFIGIVAAVEPATGD